MGDGGFCHDCRRSLSRCECVQMPGKVTADEPTCPHCGVVWDLSDLTGQFTTFNCECGWSFEAEKKQVVISRPFEQRK